MTESDPEEGSGGVRLPAEPLFTGDVVPLVGCRVVGDDWVGESGRVWPKRAPSGESGVLQRSLEETETIKTN